MAVVTSNKMTTNITYAQQRTSLFGLRKDTTITSLDIPNSMLEYKGPVKQFVVYVSDKDHPHHLQKLNSTHTLSEAKRIIEYEIEDEDDRVFGADYTDGFVFKVKDMKELTMYIYDTKKKSLEPYLG